MTAAARLFAVLVMVLGMVVPIPNIHFTELSGVRIFRSHGGDADARVARMIRAALDFWAEQPAAQGVDLDAVVGVVYDSRRPSQRWCGVWDRDRERGGAYICGNRVIWDRGGWELEDGGTLAAMIGHEIGHYISPDAARDAKFAGEQFADCAAGVFLATMPPETITQARVGIILAGDGPLYDPESRWDEAAYRAAQGDDRHGTWKERVAAFDLGRHGGADACFAAIPDGSGVNPDATQQTLKGEPV